MSHPFYRSHVPGVILLSLFFGTALVVSRFAVSQYHPFSYISIRLALAALLALLWVWVRERQLPRGRTLWRHGVVVGIFSTAAPMLGAVTSLQFQSSGVTSLCVSLTPIAAMLFGHVLLEDDRLTRRKVAGAVVSLSGVAMLIATGETGLGEPRWEGFAISLSGVAMNGFGIAYTRRHLSGARSADITLIRLATAAIITLPLALLVDGFDLSRVNRNGVVALVYAVFFGGIFAFLLYSFLTSRFGPSKATQMEYLVPVVAVTTGAIFLGERVTPVILGGMILTISGIVITMRRRPALAR